MNERYIKLQWPDKNGVNLAIGDTIEYWNIDRDEQEHADPPGYVEHLGWTIKKVTETFALDKDDFYITIPGRYYDIDHFQYIVGNRYWTECKDDLLKELREKSGLPEADWKQLIEYFSGFTITEQFAWFYSV